MICLKFVVLVWSSGMISRRSGWVRCTFASFEVGKIELEFAIRQSQETWGYFAEKEPEIDLMDRS